MKFDRTVSTNVTSVGRQNPDDRQDYNDANYLDALRSENKMIDSPPMPRPDPRDQIKNTKGFGAPSGTYGDLSGRMADDGWVKDHQNDLGQNYYGNFFGMDYTNRYPAEDNQPDQTQFLLDTFKRARQGGLGSVIAPYLNTFVSGSGLPGLPSTAFEGQAGLN